MSSDEIRHDYFNGGSQQRPTVAELGALRDVMQNPKLVKFNASSGNDDGGANGISRDLKRFVFIAVLFALLASNWFDGILQSIFPTSEYVSLGLRGILLALAYTFAVALKLL